MLSKGKRGSDKVAFAPKGPLTLDFFQHIHLQLRNRPPQWQRIPWTHNKQIGKQFEIVCCFRPPDAGSDKIDFDSRWAKVQGGPLVVTIASNHCTQVYKSARAVQGNHCNQPWTGVISHPHHSGSLGHLGIKSNACLPPIFGAAPMRSNRTTPKVFNTTASLSFAKGYHRTTDTALVTIVMCKKNISTRANNFVSNQPVHSSPYILESTQCSWHLWCGTRVCDKMSEPAALAWHATVGLGWRHVSAVTLWSHLSRILVTSNCLLPLFGI